MGNIAQKKMCELLRVFLCGRENQKPVSSESYRSLSVGSRPSLLAHYVHCGVSVVSLVHWSRADDSPNTQIFYWFLDIEGNIIFIRNEL